MPQLTFAWRVPGTSTDWITTPKRWDTIESMAESITAWEKVCKDNEFVVDIKVIVVLYDGEAT